MSENARPRFVYKNALWLPRALAFARTLPGRPLTRVEQEIHDESSDPWDFFMVYGIQPETQNYIDKTIMQLEAGDPDDLGSLLTTEIRLAWSAEMLVGRKIEKRGKKKGENQHAKTTKAKTD